MKKNIERDENNLIKGLDYEFDNDGQIIWRRLIKNEHLVPNKDRTTITDVRALEDKDILVLLSGFKYLADLHGFTKVSYKFTSSMPEFVSCVCRIDFIPSYHTEMRQISFESCADASYNNTQSIGGKYFLTTTAENRAFVRCVRNFLRIPILGKDEISFGVKPEEPQEPTNPSNPKTILNKKLSEKGFGTGDFEKLKAKLVEIGDNSFSEYTTYKDVPSSRYFELIGLLNKIK